MNHIIITEVQASQIRGNYGTIRGTDNTPTARIEPMKTPDGNYIIPEACISAFGLEAVKDTIEQMVTDDNVQEIIDLPLMGQPCEKDRLYKYFEGTEDGYNGLVKCVQAHTRTEHKPMDIPALFSFFRENSDTLEWIPNEYVQLGWKRVYAGKTYEVIQAHQTLQTWTPDVTPALWKEVIVVVDIPVWVQPTGAHDAYRLGAKVHFPTITDPVYESVINANVWSPIVYPAGWRKL